MFDVGWSELVLIGVVALIVIGPKELPTVLRTVGQWTAKIRRMAAEFQGQFNEAMREAEMADLKKQVEDINETARNIARFDPLADEVHKDASAGTAVAASGPASEPSQAPEAAPAIAAPAAGEPPAAGEEATGTRPA